MQKNIRECQKINKRKNIHEQTAMRIANECVTKVSAVPEYSEGIEKAFRKENGYAYYS